MWLGPPKKAPTSHKPYDKEQFWGLVGGLFGVTKPSGNLPALVADCMTLLIT